MPQIKDRIDVLVVELGKTVSAMEKEAGLGNATIKGWLNKDTSFSSAPVEKFLIHFRINKEWWINGTGNIFDNPKGDDILDHPLVKSFVDQINLQKKMIEILERENAQLRGRK